MRVIDKNKSYDFTGEIEIQNYISRNIGKANTNPLNTQTENDSTKDYSDMFRGYVLDLSSGSGSCVFASSR